MSPEYYLKISPETFRGIVEIVAVLIMLLGLGAVIWHRFKLGLGLSNVSLQFTAVIFVFPIILILSLEGVFKGETAGTLIGALAGYLFSEFGKNGPASLKGPKAQKPGQKPFGDSNSPDFEHTQP